MILPLIIFPFLLHFVSAYFEILDAFPSTNYSVGGGDYRYTVCDFDGDGLEDMAHLAHDNYLHVWLSTGDGKFNITSKFPKGSSYNIHGNNYKFIKGDFNGDGKCDLVHLVGTDYLHVWLSKGDGTFKIAAPFPRSGYSMDANNYYFRPGDFDGDGKTDLIHVVNADWVHVWLSKGDGKFKIMKKFKPKEYDISSNNYNIRIADFNGDGKSDLVHMAENDYLQVWISKGDGTFDIKKPFPNDEYQISENNYNFHVGDFNGDGKADLIHFCNQDFLRVWLSNGDGTFDIKEPFPDSDYSLSNNNYKFKLGDFNGDGKTDLVHFVKNEYLQVWLSNGDGTFEILAGFPNSDYALSSNNYHFKVGDFDGDHKDDLVHFVNNEYLHVWKSTVNQTDVEMSKEMRKKARKYKNHDEF